MSYCTIAELRDYLDQLPNYGQQLITVTGTPFTVSYEGTATGNLASTVTATAVQTALRAIAAIGSGGVNVRGKPGGPFTASFQGVLATDAALMTATNATIAVANDAKLQRVLDRATAIIDLVLGSSFTLSGSAGTRIVYGDGTDYLEPPAFVSGSVTAVTAPTGYTIPTYTVIDGVLIITRDSVYGPLYGSEALAGRLYHPFGGWLAGVPWTVAATYGYSAYPADIVEACLEIAVDLWRFKDAGSIKSVGVEGAGIVTGKGLPATARLILDKRLADATFPGVY